MLNFTLNDIVKTQLHNNTLIIYLKNGQVVYMDEDLQSVQRLEYYTRAKPEHILLAFDDDLMSDNLLAENIAADQKFTNKSSILSTNINSLWLLPALTIPFAISNAQKHQSTNNNTPRLEEVSVKLTLSEVFLNKQSNFILNNTNKSEQLILSSSLTGNFETIGESYFEINGEKHMANIAVSGNTAEFSLDATKIFSSQNKFYNVKLITNGIDSKGNAFIKHSDHVTIDVDFSNPEANITINSINEFSDLIIAGTFDNQGAAQTQITITIEDSNKRIVKTFTEHDLIISHNGWSLKPENINNLVNQLRQDDLYTISATITASKQNGNTASSTFVKTFNVEMSYINMSVQLDDLYISGKNSITSTADLQKEDLMLTGTVSGATNYNIDNLSYRIIVQIKNLDGSFYDLLSYKTGLNVSGGSKISFGLSQLITDIKGIIINHEGMVAIKLELYAQDKRGESHIASDILELDYNLVVQPELSIQGFLNIFDDYVLTKVEASDNKSILNEHLKIAFDKINLAPGTIIEIVTIIRDLQGDIVATLKNSATTNLDNNGLPYLIQQQGYFKNSAGGNVTLDKVLKDSTLYSIEVKAETINGDTKVVAEHQRLFATDFIVNDYIKSLIKKVDIKLDSSHYLNVDGFTAQDLDYNVINNANNIYISGIFDNTKLDFINLPRGYSYKIAIIINTSNHGIEHANVVFANIAKQQNFFNVDVKQALLDALALQVPLGGAVNIKLSANIVATNDVHYEFFDAYDSVLVNFFYEAVQPLVYSSLANLKGLYDSNQNISKEALKHLGEQPITTDVLLEFYDIDTSKPIKLTIILQDQNNIFNRQTLNIDIDVSRVEDNYIHLKNLDITAIFVNSDLAIGSQYELLLEWQVNSKSGKTFTGNYEGFEFSVGSVIPSVDIEISNVNIYGDFETLVKESFDSDFESGLAYIDLKLSFTDIDTSKPIKLTFSLENEQDEFNQVIIDVDVHKIQNNYIELGNLDVTDLLLSKYGDFILADKNYLVNLKYESFDIEGNFFSNFFYVENFSTIREAEAIEDFTTDSAEDLASLATENSHEKLNIKLTDLLAQQNSAANTDNAVIVQVESSEDASLQKVDDGDYNHFKNHYVETYNDTAKDDNLDVTLLFFS